MECNETNKNQKQKTNLGELIANLEKGKVLTKLPCIEDKDSKYYNHSHWSKNYLEELKK